MGNKKEIKTILIVLVLSVVVAGLIAFFFIYNFSPSGNYEAKNTLLDPNIIERLNYPEKDSKSGQTNYYMFDRTEVNFFDIKKNQAQKKQLTSLQYQLLYQLLELDHSIHFVSDEVLNGFILSSPLQITTYMINTHFNENLSKTTILQNIQIIENDYYRIQLQGKIESGGWAYFYHRGIYQEVMHLINR